MALHIIDDESRVNALAEVATIFSATDRPLSIEIFDEALVIAKLRENLFQRSYSIKKIAVEAGQAGLFDYALNVARQIENAEQFSDAIKQISIQLGKKKQFRSAFALRADISFIEYIEYICEWMKTLESVEPLLGITALRESLHIFCWDDPSWNEIVDLIKLPR